jgi:hypothetical protein
LGRPAAVFIVIRSSIEAIRYSSSPRNRCARSARASCVRPAPGSTIRSRDPWRVRASSWSRLRYQLRRAPREPRQGGPVGGPRAHPGQRPTAHDSRGRARCRRPGGTLPRLRPARRLRYHR